MFSQKHNIGVKPEAKQEDDIAVDTSIEDLLLSDIQLAQPEQCSDSVIVEGHKND